MVRERVTITHAIHTYIYIACFLYMNAELYTLVWNPYIYLHGSVHIIKLSGSFYEILTLVDLLYNIIIL